MKRIFLYIILFFCCTSIFAATPLSTDQAFQFSATAKDYQTILLNWKIAPNYYLYKKDFRFTVVKPAQLQLGDAIFPSDTVNLKTALGDFLVYANELILPLPVNNTNSDNVTLKVHYQGCSKSGFCYPPVTKLILVNLRDHFGKPVYGLNIDSLPEKIIQSKPITPRSLFITLLTFFGFGILLSLTPCVLPMIPVLSSIILGQKNTSHWHALILSIFYVFGMAVAYALLGFIFGLLGRNLQIIFQNPMVIIAFSILFILMALSLFGLFQLQLPARFQRWASVQSHHQKKGTYAGVFMMGILSTFILSPCVTPPLVTALGWVSQQGNIWIGAFSLFAMGLGMGAPLLLIGFWGRKILPTAGPWMNTIKYFLGVLLLIVAASMLWRIAPHTKSKTTPLPFHSVQSLQNINDALKTAGDKPVMLDFYADWCIACKEFDLITFQNLDVKKALSPYVLLRVDVTQNTVEDQLIEQHFQVIAPPTILFFKNKQEIPNTRIIGYQPQDRFLRHLARIGQ